jgi:hypothetical protein
MLISIPQLGYPFYQLVGFKIGNPNIGLVLVGRVIGFAFKEKAFFC